MSDALKKQIEKRIASCKNIVDVEYEKHKEGVVIEGTVECGGYIGKDGPFFCDDCDGLLIQLEIM